MEGRLSSLISLDANQVPSCWFLPRMLARREESQEKYLRVKFDMAMLGAPCMVQNQIDKVCRLAGHFRFELDVIWKVLPLAPLLSGRHKNTQERACNNAHIRRQLFCCHVSSCSDIALDQVFEEHLPGTDFINTLPPFCEPEGPPSTEPVGVGNNTRRDLSDDSSEPSTSMALATRLYMDEVVASAASSARKNSTPRQ